MKIMDDDKITIEFDEKDGAIIFISSDGPQEQFLIPTGLDEDSDKIRASIAFFVYATQRIDWIKEFNDEMSEAFADEKEHTTEEEKKAKRSHLKVVK
jgi:hypothetical protein